MKCFNNLFDCFNSLCLESGKPYRSAISKDSKHHQFLDTMTKLLSTVHIINQHDIDITSRVKCFHSSQQNITALKLLFMKLSNLHWFKFIFTRRLYQDTLEILIFLAQFVGKKVIVIIQLHISFNCSFEKHVWIAF